MHVGFKVWPVWSYSNGRATVAQRAANVDAGSDIKESEHTQFVLYEPVYSCRPGRLSTDERSELDHGTHGRRWSGLQVFRSLWGPLVLTFMPMLLGHVPLS